MTGSDQLRTPFRGVTDFNQERAGFAQSYHHLLYHLVFSTKDRRPFLDGEIGGRMHAYLGGALRSEGGIALEIGGTGDHVHLLAKLPADKSVSDVLRDIKANASGWVHRTFSNAKESGWQRGYGAFSVSQSQVDKVVAYIRNQKEHHSKASFADEMAVLLRAHGIEFDERSLQ